MTIPTPLEFSVFDFMQAIESRKPKDHANLLRILRLLLPAMAKLDDLAPVDVERLEELARQLPASGLLDCVIGKKGRWAPWLVEAVPELATIKAYKDDYRRCLNRCLDHAAASRFISRSANGVAPAWQQARARLIAALPYNKRTLQALLDRGETEVFGHSLVERPFKTTQNFFRSFIDAFNDLGRHMTSGGIEHPQNVRVEHFYGAEGCWHAHRIALGTAGRSMYFRGRLAWEVLQQLEPDWHLTNFPHPGRDRVYAIAEEDLPPLGKQMLSSILEKTALKPAMRQHVREHLCRLFGVLHNKLDLDVYVLCNQLEDERDLAYLLLAGYPPSPDGRDPDPAQELHRLFSDQDYLEEVVEALPNVNRKHAFKAACRDNPVLVAYKGWLLERGVASNLEVGLKTFRIIGEHYLQVHETQKAWLNKLLQSTIKAKKASPPTDRALRKRAVANSQELWLELVSARTRLTAYTEQQRLTLEGVLADSTKTPMQMRSAEQRWAVAVRDELMINFLLAFQLRKENIQGLRIGVEIFPAEYRISIPPNKAKAGEWINRQFPEDGPFSDLMGLLDRYLEEARPILLAGRSATPYLFLTIPKGQEVRDDGGNLRMGRDQLAVVLRKASERHFKDILPPGVGLLHPHLLRDAFAGHALRTPGGVMLAAQGLANTPGVIHGHYVQTSRQNDREVRSHLEQLDVAAKPPSRQTRVSRLKTLREEFKKLLPNASPREIEAAVRIAERSA